MNASEKIAAVPGTYEPDSEEEGNTVTVPSSATRQRTEKRFEIGLFLRRRFRRRLRKHQLAVGVGSLAPAEKKDDAPPPTAFTMSARGGGGGPQGSGSPDDPQTADVLPGQETGPIKGTTSYEVGAFVGVTTETTTDDDDA